MDLKEKTGDFLLDIAKLVFGGIIVAGIVAENIDRIWLYTIGCIVFALSCIAAYSFYKQVKRKED